MNDYTKFDAALLAHIGAGKRTLPGLLSQADLTDLAKPFSGRLTGPYRIIDRRLQALRKAGRITFDRKEGWKLVKAKA